ncbi:MAG: aldo/keto reductase [Paracoccaceae bacterium]
MTQLKTRIGAPVRPFSFGTMQFGGTADHDTSSAMFHACLEAGITHFDTAYLYNDGASEQILGALIKGRDDLYIATKVGYQGTCTKAQMMAQFETCLSRLQRDHVDLLYLHHLSPGADLREIVDMLATVQAKGQIRHLGLSNLAAWQVMQAQSYAADFGTRIDVLQPMYNLVKRQAEVEILPMCADQGIAICTYSPLGGGLLTGKYASGGTGRLTEDMRYNARYDVPAMAQAAQDLSVIAADMSMHPATLAAAWVAASPFGTQPILSARNVDQLGPSLAALNFEMDAALYARLSALMPTPPPATDRLEEQ